MVCLYLLKIFSTICDPILASVLPLKAMVSCISRTCDFEPKISGKKCGLYTSKYGNTLYLSELKSRFSNLPYFTAVKPFKIFHG